MACALLAVDAVAAPGIETIAAAPAAPAASATPGAPAAVEVVGAGRRLLAALAVGPWPMKVAVAARASPASRPGAGRKLKLELPLGAAVTGAAVIGVAPAVASGTGEVLDSELEAAAPAGEVPGRWDMAAAVAAGAALAAGLCSSLPELS